MVGYLRLRRNQRASERLEYSRRQLKDSTAPSGRNMRRASSYGIQLFRGIVDARIRDLDERIQEQIGEEDVSETDGDSTRRGGAGFDASFDSPDFDGNGAIGQ